MLRVRKCAVFTLVCLVVLLVASNAGLRHDGRGSSQALGSAVQRRGYSLKIVSWNVECLNRASSAELSKALLETQADIILTQEDLEYPDLQGVGLILPGYIKGAECRRNALWESYREYSNGARYLSNAAYFRASTVELVSAAAEIIAADSLDPRCAAVLDVQPKDFRLPRALRVASTHLTGGRFSDSKWEERLGLKRLQVQSLMTLLPDVVTGDMNSYTTIDDAKQAQANYSVYRDALEAGKESQYLGWTIEPLDEFVSQGMRRLPLNLQTSQYGGTVDHAFTAGARNGLNISLTNPTLFSSQLWKLSDHNGLGFDVRVDNL